MSQSVYQLPKETIHEMKRYYSRYLKDQSPPGSVFTAKINNCTITAYHSGKVLFQGADHQREAAKWADSQTLKEDKKKNTNLQLPSWLQGDHIGTDEAGTGDYFGPITVAGVYVKAEQIETLKNIGIQDSKNLSDKAVKEIARDIVRIKLPYTLLTLDNQKYNQLQRKGWSQGKMKTLLHYHVIEKLKKKVADAPLSGVIIDQFAEKDIFMRHLQSENKDMPHDLFFLKKAESHSLAVAAASIIARTKFLSELEKLSERLQLQLPKGAGHQVDEQAARLIKEKGKEILESCAKVHFANTKKAERLLNQ
ncbi:MAG: ribonuclease HIII [Bacillaceae bacterium]|nr:ribonuclease HIII [Bacillaceae bacterium]